MGEVYRARDTRLDRTVAIKVIAARIAQDPDARKRLIAEARAVSLLNHPNICALYDIGAHEQTDFLVMELLEGETLAERLRSGALPFPALIRIGTEIAQALDAAHAQGVVHRDLKPGNVMLTRSGAKLLDFGIAKTERQTPADSGGKRSFSLESTDAAPGTPPYMAPEQIEGHDVDSRADVFALGAVLYEMATGRKAFEGASQTSLTAAIVGSDPMAPSGLRPGLPPAFDRLVARCLAKDPEERWQSVRDILFQLRALAEPDAVGRGRVTAFQPDDGLGDGCGCGRAGAGRQRYSSAAVNPSCRRDIADPPACGVAAGTARGGQRPGTDSRWRPDRLRLDV